MSTTPEADVHLAVTIEEIDHSTSADFWAELADGLRRYEEGPRRGPDRPVGHLVVDLSRVRFLDSSGIRSLIDADQVALRHGGRVVISGAEGVVRRCLEVTGVYERMAVVDGDPPLIAG